MDNDYVLISLDSKITHTPTQCKSEGRSILSIFSLHQFYPAVRFILNIL
jgi:hypothetical protein